MIRRAALAGGLLAVAAVLSSCSSPSAPGSDAVAAANGTELSRSALAALMASSGPTSTDPAASSPAAADVRQAMTDWLRLAALGTDMSGVATRDDLQQASEEASATLAQPYLTDARDIYAKGWDGSPSVCLAIIQIAEGGDPQEVLDALTNGMSFADAAAKYSADPSTAADGGVVTFQDGSHCADPAALNPTVADQMKGALPGDPVLLSLTNGQGIVVIRPFDELTTADQISLDPSVQEKVSAAFGEQIANADIFVDPRYGRWDGPSASVLTLFNG